MVLRRLLRPAPHAEPIKDTAKVRKLYRYWQIRTLGGMYIGYVFFYFTRKNITVAMPGLMAEYGYSMSDLGWILTFSSLAYGISKFTSGMISDRSNPRYFMAIGLMITGVLNILFGMSASIIMLAALWGLNGWFQGFGWPPCGRLLTHWYGRKERARWWAVWNTSHNLGGFLIPILAAECIKYFGGWQWALYLPGIMSIFVGFYLINRLRDTPQSLGLPAIEVYTGEETVAESERDERELSVREILFKHVLTNKYLWVLTAAYPLVYFIRQAVNDWTVIYLVQERGCSLRAAGWALGFFEIGGLLGSLAAGWTSDILFKGKRGPVNVIFAVGVSGSLLFLWFVPDSAPVMACVGTLLVGFFIFGPQMLIGIAAAELSHKKAAATATGFTGLFAYMGAAVAGGPIAAFAERFGWGAYFGMLLGCSMVMTVMLLPMWNVTRRPEAALPDEEAAEYA